SMSARKLNPRFKTRTGSSHMMYGISLNQILLRLFSSDALIETHSNTKPSAKSVSSGSFHGKL
ncbi:MAG: hypothetical protein PHD82_13165, partial [Candidatus Riflebacteria bacterium]|nr:hypothetical protein [Candidatus Riflebacteria bacterium]